MARTTIVSTRKRAVALYTRMVDFNSDLAKLSASLNTDTEEALRIAHASATADIALSVFANVVGDIEVANYAESFRKANDTGEGV